MVFFIIFSLFLAIVDKKVLYDNCLGSYDCIFHEFWINAAWSNTFNSFYVEKH